MTANCVPVRKVALGPDRTSVERRADGTVLLRSPIPLGPYPGKLGERLAHWAKAAPGRTFLAVRHANGWRTLNYIQAHALARTLGQAMLDRGLGPGRPLAILSGNDLEHALLALAAMHVGVPYAPISPAYSLVSRDHSKLRYILGLLRPGMAFAASGPKFAPAIAGALPQDCELVVADVAPATRIATLFDSLLAKSAGKAVDEAFASVGPDTVAKILFTSGSTGQPKGVINTQRMLCSNQEMLAVTLPCLREEPPVLVDWLPWNHTFGSNHNFGLVLYNGGTLYIDEGRPAPDLFEPTLRNLREIGPTAYFNVPRGYEELATHLRREPALRDRFFSRVRFLFYAGAALSQPVWDAFEELAVQTCGERIVWITGLGATETAPLATCANREAGRAGLIGLPVVGQEMKLAPVGNKFEARFRGPNVTPGYWRQPELTRAAFDEEGYYRMGDAVRFDDPAHPENGLVFDGRLVEDFKLSSGSWVSVGPLRTRFIAAGAPYVQDVVIAGHDRGYLSALVVARLEDCRGACGLPADAPAAAVLSHAAVVSRLQALLDTLAGESSGGTTHVARAIVLDSPLSIDAAEITDKGSVNQRAVLEHRAALVEELYQEIPSARTLCANRG
ncbi:MAG TPA: feruloyl-CoA synthase [Burkholderiales bacterium]|nr:feruloyl-CoA synthase [Burkholderiales bacterium]